MPSQLIDVQENAWKNDFPILKKGVYLDSAATSQKPASVIKALDKFYKTSNANVHRGVYELSAKATEQYEGARKKVAQFINAKPWETVFVRNATEAVNLVARSWGEANVQRGDAILATVMEHHSNLVPWQQLAKRTGAKLGYIPLKDGELDMGAALQLLSKRPKLLAVTHVSNVLGTINPIKELITMCHSVGCLVLVDACQSIPHMAIDVKQLDCDFLVFSGHKLFGPTGIGVLYAKEDLLNAMPPFLSGGDMIKEVSLVGASWNDIPWKFEAGTPAVAEAVALGAAVDYLSKIGMENIAKHDHDLIAYALEKLQQVPGITIYGPKDANKRCGVIAFNLGDIHSHDLATVLDQHDVAVRSGHHCCMPLIGQLNVTATARMSVALYNTTEDIDALVNALQECRKVFKL
ncbi:cysteine desulfurase [Candidatus Woesearchaeota archaeon]|nr:cysteine desulfurase [Candidatus Woesearchaeota archaeon]